MKIIRYPPATATSPNNTPIEGTPSSTKRAASPHDKADEGNQPAKRFKPDYSDNLLTILLGADEKKFIVHKATICRRSAFFKSACSRAWKEGQENLVRLPETDAEVFEVYVHSAYSGNLSMEFMTAPADSRPPAYLNLVKVWITSNYLGNNALGNCVVDRLFQKLDSMPTHLIGAIPLQYLFDNVTFPSKLGQLFIDVMAARITWKAFDDNSKNYPLALITAFAKRFSLGYSPHLPGPQYKDRCRYHAHDEGEAVCK